MFVPRPDNLVAAGAVSTAPAIELSGLAKTFGVRPVLRDITLSVARGQSVALIGANGCGKSTLLKSLIRLVEPSGGAVRILGDEVTGVNATALRRLRSRVGMVWQKHNLVPRLSALTNVVHGVQARRGGPRSWLQSLAPSEIRDEAMDCLERVGLADRAQQRVDSLSGGQSQRVAIARMLMQRPELVLADEPDASLDPKSGDEVMALLSNLARQQNLTLVVVSHRIEHTLRFSDRIVGIANGSVALDMPTAAADLSSLTMFFDHRIEQ